VQMYVTVEFEKGFRACVNLCATWMWERHMRIIRAFATVAY